MSDFEDTSTGHLSQSESDIGAVSSSSVATEQAEDPLLILKKRDLFENAKYIRLFDECILYRCIVHYLHCTSSLVPPHAQDGVFGLYLRTARRIVFPRERVERFKENAGGKRISTKIAPEGFKGGLLLLSRVRSIIEPYLRFEFENSTTNDSLVKCVVDIIHSLVDDAAKSAIAREDSEITWTDAKEALKHHRVSAESLLSLWGAHHPPESTRALPRLLHGYPLLGSLVPTKHRTLRGDTAHTHDLDTALRTAHTTDGAGVQETQQTMGDEDVDDIEREIDNALRQHIEESGTMDNEFGDGADVLGQQEQQQQEQQQRRRQRMAEREDDESSESSESAAKRQRSAADRKRAFPSLGTGFDNFDENQVEQEEQEQERPPSQQ